MIGTPATGPSRRWPTTCSAISRGAPWRRYRRAAPTCGASSCTATAPQPSPRASRWSRCWGGWRCRCTVCSRRARNAHWPKRAARNWRRWLRSSSRCWRKSTSRRWAWAWPRVWRRRWPNATRSPPPPSAPPWPRPVPVISLATWWTASCWPMRKRPSPAISPTSPTWPSACASPWRASTPRSAFTTRPPSCSAGWPSTAPLALATAHRRRCACATSRCRRCWKGRTSTRPRPRWRKRCRARSPCLPTTACGSSWNWRRRR